MSKIAVPGIHSISARHLQTMRSIPSKSLVSTVVGMKQPDHVRANLEVIKKAPMTRAEFFEGIKPVRRAEFIEDELDY